MTLFGLTRNHEAAVVEIGTNHPGEIAALCRVLKPTHGLVTNIGREHLEFFRTIRRVATEEGALYEYLRRSGNGTALVNADDPWVLARAGGLRRTLKYGFDGRGLTVKGTIIDTDVHGCVSFRFAHRKARRGTTVRMAVPGTHNAANALAAATVGLALGVPAAGIRKALVSFSAVKNRMQVIRSAGIVILNDTYNANPDSMMAALQTLVTMKAKGKRIAVLGDMREMGEASEQEHRSLGREIARLGIDYLLTVGSQARHIHDGAEVKMKFHYDQKNVLAEYLLELVSPGDLVLVKGSRGMMMEDVIGFLLHRLGVNAGTTVEQARV
jgi:UDP-N-acetylmuramoyl-tripeptide--D-alanyl-D-alanine ligase